jgi:hypothetical protein
MGRRTARGGAVSGPTRNVVSVQAPIPRQGVDALADAASSPTAPDALREQEEGPYAIHAAS